MKKITSNIIVLTLLIPVSLFAHDGHIHAGTFWENVGHSILTNGFLVFPVIVAGYFLIKSLRTKAKTKIK